MLNYKYFFLLLFINFSLFGADENEIKYVNDSPVISIYIEGKRKNIAFDAGSANLTLSLDKKTLEKYGTKTKETAQSKDILGKISSQPLWKLKKVFIAGMEFNDIKAKEYSPWGMSIGKEEQNIKLDGVIGLNLFKGKKLLLNFKEDRIKILEGEPIGDHHQWRRFKEDLTFDVVIDQVKLKAVFDTGANISFRDPSSFASKPNVKLYQGIKKKSLQFAEPKNYPKFLKPLHENWQLFLLDLKEAEIDLLIGMDALKGKILFLDFVENRFLLTSQALSFENPKKSSSLSQMTK